MQPNFAKLSSQYLEKLRAQARLTASTLTNYQRELEVLSGFLSTDDASTLIQNHLAELKPSTATRKIVIWKGFLKTLPEPHKSLLSDLRMPRIRKKQPNFLTEQEAFLLEQACYRSEDQLRDRLFVAFGLQLGLRLSEILKLKFKDVEGDWLRIIRKGEKEQRLPLSPSLQSLLRQWSDEIIAKPSDWIFPGLIRGTQREPLTPRAGQILLRRLAKVAGIDKRVSPHTLRHSFATRLASQGVNLAALKELLGHESLLTTERYLHVTPEHLRDALNAGLKSTNSRPQ